MSIFRKTQHKLLKKLTAAATVIGSLIGGFSFSSTASAEIVKVDGGKLTDTQGRFDIYADALINGNKTAINHFSKFNLDANQIANMYYRTAGAGLEANSLLNFINEKSTINGVVNAVKNGTIGGNLFFIAPKGIVVGSSGVINAGSIGLMTPTQDFYNSLMNGDKIDQSKLTADVIKNIEAADIPLNLSGSISISGKLNAVDGIKVASAAIKLKDEAQLVSTKDIDFSALVNVSNVDSGLDSSKLKITRSKDADGAINLIAVADAKEIENFENITWDKFKEKVTSIKSVDGVKTVFKDLTDVDAEASIKVGEKTKIQSDANISITATAKGDRHTDDEGKTVNESLPFLNLTSKIEVNGEVSGETVSINAKTEDIFKETVKVTPKPKDDDKDKDESKDSSKDENLESKLGEVMSKYLQLSGAYVVHNDEASVTVGKDAKITANGEDELDKETFETNPALQITAKSAPTVELTAKGETEEKNQLLAVTAAFVNNSANVEINGAINSSGSAEIKADATADIKQTSTNKATAKDTSKLNFAGNVLIGNNKANLNLGEKSAINAGGNVTAVANAKEKINAKAEVSIKETGLGGSSINFTNFDSNADTEVSGKVINSSKLEISAKNEVNRTVISNNGTDKISTDKEKDDKDKDDKEKETEKKTSTDTDKKDTSNNEEEEDEFGLAALFADTSEVTQDKVKDEDAAPPAGSEDKDAKDQATADKQEDAQTKNSAWDNAAKYLTVGASANIVLAEDKATVTINDTADLKSSGKLTIEAKNNLTDQKIGAVGQTSAGSSGENKKALVNAAVNVTNFDSDAAVLVKGGSINGGTVEINADNTIGDKRKAEIIETIKRTKDEIEALTKSDTWSGYKDDLVAFKDSLEVAAKYLFSNETIKPEDLKMTDEEINAPGEDGEEKTIEEKMQQKILTDVMMNGLTVLGDGMTLYGTYNDAKTVLGYTCTLTDPSTYSNFYVDSSTTSTAVKDRSKGTADGSSAASLAIAGAVNVNLSDDSTRLVIGKGANIVSSGDVKINSINSRDNVVADGHLKPTGAAATSIGAIVNVNNLNSTNVLAVAQGATLEGKSLDLKANNNISNIILNSGAGAAADKASTTGNNTTSANTVAVEGTISYVGGKSDALLSVDDGAILKTNGDLKLNAINKNDLYNIAGGLSYGHGAGSVGVGLAINNFDVNTLSAIQNNDKNSSADMIDLVKAAANADALFGSGNKGTFNAGNFNSSADTSGNMIALSVAGAAIEQQDKGSESSRTLENFGNGLSNKYKSLTDNKFVNFFKDKKTTDKNKDKKTDDSKDKSSKIKDSADKTLKNSDSNKSEKPKDKDATKLPNNTAGQDMPSITVTGAGSASVNLSTIKTKSIIDGVTINSNKDFKVTADDSTNNVAASGAAALNFQKVGLSKNTTNSSTNVGIAGAVAWNKVTDDLKAIVKNSTINASSGNAEISAEKGGALVAAGLGFSITSTSRQNSTSVNVAANLSVNHADESTYADISNSTLNAKTLKNSAINSDVQVTGGINLAVAKGGKSANAIGATVGYSDISNESLARIENNSKINLTGDLTNTANTNIKQITGVVGASVATGAQKNNAFNGVLAYSKIDNTADAKVDSSTIKTTNLINRAFDGEISNKNVNYLEGAGIDTSGADFLKNVSDDSSAADSNVGTMSTNSTGNLQIVGAFDLTVSTGSNGGAGLVAVTIGDIDNDFNSIVNNSNVTGNIDADALSNSLAVNAAGGVAVSNGKFGGAGSASWQTTDNQVKAAVTSDNSNTVTGNVDLNANSKAREVSVAGQIGVSKGTAVGLAMAYNNLNLTTETDLKNITINGTNVKTTSKNDGAIYAIGAGINASKGTSINGSAAVNYGTNSAISNIDGVTAAKATTLETTATDETYRLAIGGGANIGKTVAVGGAVVYNDIGTSDNNQKTKVTVNNSKFTNLTGATIKTEDNSTLKSIAAQLSGGGKVAANGAVAVTTIYKNVGNNITNSELAGKLTASSNSTQDIFTTADALAVGGKVGVGAGVAVTNDHTKTTTAFDSSTINGNNIEINSANKSELTNIAVGAAGSGNVSVAGSVSINNLSGNTSATLNNTNVTATKNFAVTASGDETINNYAGALSIAAGTGAAVGASVSVNNIENTTAATVTGGTINVTGKDTISFKDMVADDKIINTSISKDLFQTDNSLASLKTNSTYNGFLVDAVSTNTLKSFQICGGVAGTGASVGGTVNVQNIGGSTTAKVDNADIKGNSDVNVIAHDYTNSEAMVGQIAVTGTGAAVGAAIDIQTVTRDVNSELNAKSGTSINAGNVKVNADSKQGIASLAVSGGVAGTGAAVNNATGVYNLKGTTTAKASALNGNANNFGVNANHLANINSVGAMAAIAGEGAGVGATVVIVNETDTTSAKVDNSNLTADTSDISAKNKLNLSDQAYAVSGAGVGAGVGGLVEVGNISNTVNATVSNSTLGKAENKKIAVTADNTTSINNIAGNGSFAGIGGAVGAGVEINTLDSQVSTNIEKSTLNAKDITVDSKDDKTIKQLGVGASLGGIGAGVQVGVMITNVGEKIADSYESSSNKGKKDKDGTQVDAKKSMNTANNAVTENLNMVNGSDSNIKTLGLKVDTDAATAGKGSAKGGVTNNIKNSTINSGNTLKVTANGANNFDQSGVAGAGSGIGASAAGSIGIMNFKYNTSTDITSSTLKATKNIDINTTTSGTNKLNLATASVAIAGASIGVGYGDLTTKGNNAINLKNSTIESTGGNVSINTTDKTQTELNSKSFTFSGGISGGAVIGEVTANATNNIDISGGSIKGNTINVNATRGESGKNTFKLDSTAATASTGFSGNALVADLDANDKVNVNVGGSTKLNGTTININATNNQQTLTDVDASSVGTVSANVTVVQNKQSGTATVDVAKGVEFAAKNNNVTANMNGTQNLKTFALSVGAGAVEANISKVTDNATASAKVNGGNFTTSGANINVTSNNNVNQNAEVTGIAGAILASGTTKLESARNVTNEVNFVNSGNNKNFGTVNAAANTNSNATLKTISGKGGALEISPEAAYLNDSNANNTKVSINGDFTANTINVTATTTENETRKVDATSASLAGYSGAALIHKDTTSTTINVADKSDFVSPNNLTFSALNKINSTSELIGVGAGAIRGNAADTSDGGNYSATVNLGNNTTYKTDKNFTAQSADELNIKSSNLLKAYDIGSLTIANSKNNFEFKNTVTGGKNTINADNIYLKAGESGKVNLSTIADHKGGAGVAETHAYNTINRADTVTVGDNSNLRATTVNLTSKTADLLDLNLQSNVFNYAAVPVKTAANMSLTLNQNNAINVGKGAKLTADEEMVLDGAGTVTNLVKSVRYYSTYDGGGEKTVGTNDGNEKIGAMTTNNVVNVNGTLEAGTHNKIGIEITGNNYKITDGADWFTGKVTFKNDKTTNPYYKRWQEVTSAMNDYPSDSEQYKALDTERASLVSQMNEEGFLKNGKPIETLTENDVAVLPNMRVSGADIKLYGDKMTGNGSITAHRGSNINILRKNGGAIEIDDKTSVTFGNLGGIVSFNDAVAKSDNKLKVTSEINDVIPVINIENKSSRSDTNSGDIKISGVIDNPAGNVKITTNNGSINAHGIINAQSVSMSAPRGSFTMINEQALVNFSDPITYFTLGDKDIANYIQKKVALQAGRGYTNLTFSNATDFGNWLYDLLKDYKQTATLNKYGDANNKSSWVNSYVDKVNKQMKGGKIVAGGDIFIKAKDINVNGLIQSGFTKYTAEVDTSKVNSIKSSGNLTDDKVLGNNNYLVTKNYTSANTNDMYSISGLVKNSNGYYDKQIELYYNPTTGNILANDIYSNGGNVTLKGNILSTGNGKIVVSNGAADVSVKNESNKNLKLGTIESKESKGMVTIIDKKQNNKTTTFSTNGTYNPAKNLSYKWTGGGNYTKYTDHTISIGTSEILDAVSQSTWDFIKSITGGISGLKSYVAGFRDQFISHFYNQRTTHLSDSSYTTYHTDNDAIKKNGIYIAQGSSTSYLTINSQKRNVSSSKSNKHIYPDGDFSIIPPKLWLAAKITWDEKETGSVTSTYSMKADNPIDIKFVKGNGIVNLTTKGGITDTTVTAKKLDLTNHSSKALNVNFNTIGTGTLNVDTQGDAVLNVGGSVNVDIPHASGKNVTLNATGDITGGGDGDFGTLNLNSSKGKIDVKLTYITRNGLNATAAKDINIEQNNTFDSNKYLKLGKIESKTGNVSIKTNGDLVSAVTGKQNTTTATQIENWKNAGIFNTWNQTELVNALNANVFSKDPYTVDLAPTANIIANKVTLDVGGSIGSTGTAKTIKYSDLKNTSNLQLLANARVGDLEWRNNSLTYTPHYPIGVTLRDNTSDWNLYLKKSDGGVNLAAADNKTAFNIKTDGEVGSTDKDVILTAATGIKSANQINAKNLTLHGGSGNIDFTCALAHFPYAKYLDVTTGTIDLTYIFEETSYVPSYIDVITGGDIKISQTNETIVEIKNAIAEGNFILNAPKSAIIGYSKDNYISAGSDKEINMNVMLFGSAASWGKQYSPYILANGEYLSIHSKENDNFTLNGLTGKGLVNKIYRRRNAINSERTHYFTIEESPKDVFVQRN